MAKTKLTKQLEIAIQNETSDWFGCLEVTIGWHGNQRVDFMTMDAKEIFRCFEIKISKSDFRSKNGHNFVGHFNYYVMPIELYNDIKNEIPKHIGVYTWNNGYLTLTKNPKKQDLQVDINILKNSMIRSLYRDACKIKSSKNVELMKDLKNRNKKLDEERNKYRRRYQEYKSSIYFELGKEKFEKFQDKYGL